MIKGFYKKPDKPEPPTLTGGIDSILQTVKDLNATKKDVVDTLNTKIREVDTHLETAEVTLEEKVKEIDSTIENANFTLNETLKQVSDYIKEIKQIDFTGEPGKDANEVDRAQIIKDVLAQIPPVAEIIPLDEAKLLSKFLKKIPNKKGDLKIIQEKVEIDPMSVIEKIMELPDGVFKLKSSQIEGLEQTIKAFHNQLGRGYLHGGGDTVSAGTNISITTNSAGQKVISSTLPVLAGVTALNGMTGAITLAAGSNITISPSGNVLTISASSGGATQFIQLTDVPNSYAGQAGKAVRVNAGATALEFFTATGSGTVTNVASADGSILVTNPTTTVDLAVVSAPILTTARTIGGVSFNGSANITVATATGGFTVTGGALTLTDQNMVLSATTGTKFGTATTQKLAFYNSTPIVQPTGDVITALQNLGLVASATVAATTITSRTLWGQTYDGSGNVSGSLISVGDITGGASSMIIQAGTGASRTLTLKTTTSGSAAQTNLTLNADQSSTFSGLVALGANSLTMTGSLAATGARVTKGWFTDIESTNMPTVGGTAILTSLSAPQFTTIELGNVSDTTLARVGAGVVSIEGVTIATSSNTLIFTGKTYDTAGSGNVFKINGTGISDITGTGKVVLDTSPTLTTAVLGSSTATTQSPNDNSTKLATTAYVDNAILGQRYKEAVKYATTAALATVVYANGSSGVGATLTAVGLGAISIDGATPSAGDRVLVKNQVSTFQNGIYLVTVVGNAGVAFVLTRAIDFNQAEDIQTGDSVFITAGTAYTSTTWAYTGGDNPVMGTDAITFVQAAGQGSFTAGNGISITGVSIAIDTSVTVDKNTVQTLTNKSISASQITAGTFASGSYSFGTGNAVTLGTIELGAASDTTISRVSAGVIAVEGVNVLLNGGALGTPSSGTLTNATGLPIAGLTASTSTAIGVGSIELGAASDTTIARVSAGVVSIEGINIVTVSSTDTLTNKTLTSPIIQTLPVLATGTLIKFTVPTVDDTATGDMTNEFNSGYSSSAIGDLVYLDSSATWQKADADASATTYQGFLGIALEVKASGNALKVLLRGFAYCSTAFPTFTIGGRIFMSATAGAVTQTAPTTTDSATRVLGHAVHADKMWFNGSLNYFTHT